VGGCHCLGPGTGWADILSWWTRDIRVMGKDKMTGFLPAVCITHHASRIAGHEITISVLRLLTLRTWILQKLCNTSPHHSSMWCPAQICGFFCGVFSLPGLSELSNIQGLEARFLTTSMCAIGERLGRITKKKRRTMAKLPGFVEARRTRYHNTFP